jgi:hypothetical protein
LEVMREEAPSIFGDYDTTVLYDGSIAAGTLHKKV